MKKYYVRYSKRAIKELNKLDKYTKQLIYAWITKKLDGCENPRSFGKSLSADKKGLWRYRMGDYRLICYINDNELIILALMIGHRREVYDK